MKSAVDVTPVDRLAGFDVNVGLPLGWDPFESAAGLRVWVCRNDPLIAEFCANAVLTMHCIKAELEAGEVFAMVAEQQLQSVPESRELRREVTAATEGPGVVGALAMEIGSKPGIIDSVCQSRIITTDRETLIAQLTVTALHNSSVRQDEVWLTVRKTGAAGSAGHYDWPPMERSERAH